jgi:glycosyltransferase involved in cell wall biosynthesis
MTRPNQLIGKLRPRARERLNILQVSTTDRGGGAEKVAWDLFQAYGDLGHNSWLAVRTKKTDDPNVISLPADSHRSAWACFWLSMRQRRQNPFVADRLEWIAEPARKLKVRLGLEDFEFPLTRRLLDLTPDRPDVIHCHNLHQNYFDLRTLAVLSRQVPVVLTLHDEWLLTGHCAYALNCERWKTGCGSCPDLQIYPSVTRDATAYNWRRKQAVFLGSRLYVSTPSRWLKEKVGQSMLAPGIVQNRLIPYGVDLGVFRPADRLVARTNLGIPHHAKVLLFVANRVRRNPFKDFMTVRSAVARVGESLKSRDIIFIALGEEVTGERIGDSEIRFVSYQINPGVVAQYYHAADLYLHAAKADNFPNTVLEALACGTPVIATAVGGIPEQVKGLRDLGIASSKWNRYGANEATGVLVKRGDADAMAGAIQRLLNDRGLFGRLAENAATDASQRFDLNREVAQYLDWYEKLIEDNAGLK